MLAPQEWIARAGRSREDGFGEKRRDDPVRRVDDLADLQIDGDAAENIGLLAAEPALLDEVLDHVADRLLGVGEEIGAVRRGDVARAALECRGDGAARPEPRLAESAAGLEPEAQGYLRHHLDRGHADLAVALGRVGIADAEQRAVD